jgi:protein TonB
MSGYPAFSYTGPSGCVGRYGGIAIAIGLHAIVIVALLSMAPVRSALTSAAIVVRLVTAPPRVEVKPDVMPKSLPVKPRVRQAKPVPAPTVTTPVVEAPTAFVAAPAPPVPLPPIEAPPPPVAAAPVIAPPAPAPMVPPSFNADYLNNPPPAYPAVSRRLREEGKVVLRVFVSEQGLPTEVQMRTPSGHALLDEAAMNTVKQWKFVPARRGDTPVGAWVLVPISFSLRS